MAVNIPAADSLCDFDPDVGLPSTNVREEIGTITGTINIKVAGGLPITTGASSWQSDDGNTGGYLFEGQNGPWDVSSETRILVWQWQHNAPNRIMQNTVANGGITIRLVTGTGTTNYREYYISGQDTFGGSSQLGPVPMVIDLNNTDIDASSGTYDNTDVQCYGFIQNVGQQPGSGSSWTFVQRAHIFETSKNATNIVRFTGTSGLDDLIEGVLGVTYTTKIGSWVTRLSNTYFIPVAFQIGDTSTATNFDCVGKTIVSPSNNDATDPRFRLTTQATRIYIVLRDNVADDADLDNSTWVWGTAAPFDFDVSNNSVITIEGAVFSGMGAMTLGSSVVGAASFALASGSILTINDADIDGSTVTGDVDLDSATDLTNVTITGDLRITTGADSTLNFDNVTVTGSVYNDSGSNTLTISATNGSSLTAGDAGTGNGQTNIENNVILEVNGVTSGNEPTNYVRCHIEALTGGPESVGTILMNEEAQTADGGTYKATEPYNYSSDQPVVIRARYKGYLPFTTTGIVTSAGLTITAVWVVDSNYN